MFKALGNIFADISGQGLGRADDGQQVTGIKLVVTALAPFLEFTQAAQPPELLPDRFQIGRG